MFRAVVRKTFRFDAPKMMNLICWFTDVDRF